MPALTMKNKLSSECVRQHGLHVCRNSTKISKDSCSQVKSLEQAAVLDTCIQNHQDGSSNIDISGQDIVITEAKDFQNILDEASTHILKVSSLSAPLSIGQLGSLSATCPCNMETIFSHNLEDNDAQLKLMNHNDAETLVHSTLEHCDDADFTFPVFLNMKQHTVYVRCRPHLQLFLERVAQIFEIVIFTASQSIYAEQLLDILDPEKKLISQRIYRESCIFSDGSYTKDLTVLGVDLAKVAIIDNSPQVFQLQVNNGIPIKSWFHDPSDHALLQLLPFLESLADADDVRPIIAKKFRNKE